MNRVILAVACAAALAGCGSGPSLEQSAASWIGATEEQLVAGLGTPSSFYPAPSGDRILTYEQERIRSDPMLFRPSFGFGYGGMGYGYHLGTGWQSAELRHCAISFTVRETQVVGYQSRGNDCRFATIPAAPAQIEWQEPRRAG